MSVEDHHAESQGSVRVHVVVVSSSRTQATDTAGKRIVRLLEGHEVSGPEIVTDGIATVQAAVRRSDAQAVIFTGGTGLSASDVTAEAVEALYTRRIPGFGELFRMLSYREIGAGAWLSRATAGVVGDTLVFALPGSEKACALAVEQLILPELAHAAHQIGKEGAQPTALPKPEPEALVEVSSDGEPEPAPASGRFGDLGGRGASVSLGDMPAGEAKAGRSTGAPVAGAGSGLTGWKRAVYEIKGMIELDKREDLPQNVETLAPLIDILHTAGQTARLKLENGRTYSLWGFPDLHRPSAKVLAVGWGEPLCEILALHRYPSMTGLCIDEAFGLLPRRSANVAEICEKVTGSAPKDTSGLVFAVQGDTVWIERGRQVYRFDGRREVNDGLPKQILASLVLHWSQR